MSAFAVVYERCNTPVDSGVLQHMMERLSHRGPDGSDVLLTSQAALGHWHFWVTPEEMGERQPLELPGLPFKIVLDGRLDNRQELMSELGNDAVEKSQLSDAALILQAYSRWGEQCFEHFIGEFALAIMDEGRGELLCVRDALGDRTLFYSLNSARMLVASEPWALMGAAGISPDRDDVGVAHYFAFMAPEDGRTLFKDVRELLPAQVLAVNFSGERSWRHWQADPSARVRYRSDEEYAEHFRSLLEQSVSCRIRSAAPVGVLMSGGLDSTSVACLAARMLAPVQLTTVSYIFNELPDCDERQYIDAVTSRWGTRSIQIPCDDLWPLRFWSSWPHNPNQPEGNLYRLLKERAYRRTKQEGLSILLTGGFGDHLYNGREDWLADLIAEGRLREAGEELERHIRSAGLRQSLRAGFLQRAARRALETIPGGKRLRRPSPPPQWLTPLAAGYLLQAGTGPHPAHERQASLIGSWVAQDSSSEIFHASRHALELRHPYRDRRLVEFVLAIPAHQLYRPGHYKYILRNAMQGLLPEVIRTRPRPTSLGSLFFRGLERERATLSACMQDPTASWRKYVDSGWLSGHWRTARPKDSAEGLVAWLCVSYESWYKFINPFLELQSGDNNAEPKI